MNPQELDLLHEDARPRLSWRIGVTGHRDLSAADPLELNRALTQVFDDVAAGLALVQTRADAAQVFHPDPPVISLVSSLAEGADRFCAGIGLRRGFELRSPLPFPIEEYKRDFPNTVDGFESLLRHAEAGGIVELDGEPETGDPRNRAYMTGGEFVLRHCDLLIAIWNGDKAAGFGGTGDVVARAKSLGLPIVHIQSQNPHAIFLWEGGGATAAWTAYSPKRLSDSIAAQIFPKVRDPHHGHGATREPPLEAAKTYFLGEPVKTTGKEIDFLYKGPLAPDMHWTKRLLAAVFPRFVKLLGKKPAVPGPVVALPPGSTSEPTPRYLFLHHHRADVLATFYSNLHRSAFLLVYLLGALALISAAAAIFFHGCVVPLIERKAEYVFTGIELVLLVALSALVQTDRSARWRDRWLEYRLLAELLRQADLLAQIGRPMPIAKIDELTQDLPGRAWVMIAYSAIVRRAGLVTRSYDKAFLARLRDYTAATRLEDQVAYHRGAEMRNESISKRLRTIAEFVFYGTMAVAITKIVASGFAEPLGFALLAVALPAAAYAFFGIRAQAEFEIVGRRSERMIAKLTRHQQRLRALQGDALTSEALGREILKAAGVMRHDAADWASIFEVKETET